MSMIRFLLMKINYFVNSLLAYKATILNIITHIFVPQCNKLCGEGKQTRQVVCYQKSEGRIQVLEDAQCEDKKPDAEQPCMLHPCDGVDWMVSEWSGVSATIRIKKLVSTIQNTKIHYLFHNFSQKYN